MFKSILFILIEGIILIPVLIFALIKGKTKKFFDVGLGPLPLINNLYHKKALEKKGYKVVTFTLGHYHITKNFDYVFSLKTKKLLNLKTIITAYRLLDISLSAKIIYIYFNGGPIGIYSKFLWKVEPFIFKLAKVKTVLLGYGSDVQDLKHISNLKFKNSIIKDYPLHKLKRNIISKKIDLWCQKGDHVISGCDWVDNVFYWDTLMLSHFSIDTNVTLRKTSNTKSLKVLHAPNHKSIKGTKFLIETIKRLNEKGYPIELILVEKQPNKKVLELIQEVDIIADQFIIGWYAMFAIEAMNLSKPVMCYLREDLIDLYESDGIIKEGEIPIINTSIKKIEENLIWAYTNKDKLKQIGAQSREFVKKYHSLEFIGDIFESINKKLGV